MTDEEIGSTPDPMEQFDPTVSDTSFVELITQDVIELETRFGSTARLDLCFLSFLRRMARFGYFTLGPITIDVRLIEDLIERTVVPNDDMRASEEYIRWSSLLMDEVQRSRRKRIDELHYLLSFMRCKDGLPGRVFGELAVTREQIEQHLREQGRSEGQPQDRLLTPEQVAEYLQVHVETVRSWIRAGTLPARRVAGLRALRVRFSDVDGLLQPLDSEQSDGRGSAGRAGTD